MWKRMTESRKEQPQEVVSNVFKGAPSCLRQFLAVESLLKMMKNAFYLAPKALFVLKIFKFLSWHFGHVAKRLDKKDKVKVGLSPSKKNYVICVTESPLKMMKNAFYSILKAFFVLKIFKFLSQLFGHVGKTA